MYSKNLVLYLTSQEMRYSSISNVQEVAEFILRVARLAKQKERREKQDKEEEEALRRSNIDSVKISHYHSAPSLTQPIDIKSSLNPTSDIKKSNLALTPPTFNRPNLDMDTLIGSLPRPGVEISSRRISLQEVSSISERTSDSPSPTHEDSPDLSRNTLETSEALPLSKEPASKETDSPSSTPVTELRIDTNLSPTSSPVSSPSSITSPLSSPRDKDFYVPILDNDDLSSEDDEQISDEVEDHNKSSESESDDEDRAENAAEEEEDEGEDGDAQDNSSDVVLNISVEEVHICLTVT